jgi:hypothetical protein
MKVCALSFKSDRKSNTIMVNTDTNHDIINKERYSSRYTRGFLKMLIQDGPKDADKYVKQFYSSNNYQERLESIKYLLNVSEKHVVPASIIIDALHDFCSQVKVYVLKNYNFSINESVEIEKCLIDIALNDEKLQLRTLALEILSVKNNSQLYDLFFSSSLLKSSKESAAGLTGLYKLNKEKAYQMAKFRANTSSGNLDLAIAQIFHHVGDINDLDFFKKKLKARNKYNKIELLTTYLKMLGKTGSSALIKSHILFIIEDIMSTSKSELIQYLIMELHNFNLENQNKKGELIQFVSKKIDLLLEENYNFRLCFDTLEPA